MYVVEEVTSETSWRKPDEQSDAATRLTTKVNDWGAEGVGFGGDANQLSKRRHHQR